MRWFALFLILISISLISANEISYELSWDDKDIINGEEFFVNVKVLGQENLSYDGKLWIADSGNTISDRYDEGNDEWKSSYYYLNQNFPHDETVRVRLRIDDEYRDFSGEARVGFRVRGEDEIVKGIEVLSGDGVEEDISEEEESEDLEDNEEEDQVEVEVTQETADEAPSEEEKVEISEPISLGSKVDNQVAESINRDEAIYESKDSKTTRYAVYGFIILCVFLCVLILWRKIE